MNHWYHFGGEDYAFKWDVKDVMSGLKCSLVQNKFATRKCYPEDLHGRVLNINT